MGRCAAAIGRAVAVVALGLALAGCTSAVPAAPAPTPALAPFDDAALDEALAKLAAGGVTVRSRPTDVPLVAVDSPTRVGLLRFQARNLALEAHFGGGTLGTDLDDYAAEAGSPPLAPLVLGWLLAADTPASRAALSLVPQASGATDPATFTYPGLAMVLLLADLAGPAPVSDEAGPAPVALAGGQLIAAGDFCGQIADYLAAVLGGVLDADLELAPAWLADAIERVAGIEADPARLRSAVSALALLAYATSISRPWVATMSAVPSEVHRIVADDELTSPSKSFHLVVYVGDTTLADEAADCELLADTNLAGEGEADETAVGWVSTALPAHATDIEADLTLEELGQYASATLEYQTLPESADAHSSGAARSALVSVTAIVERQEIGELEAVVAELLTGGAAAAVVSAEYTRLQPALKKLLYPKATAKVTVTWHEEPQTPEPTLDKTQFCERYVALVRWTVEHADSDYELTRPWALEIASQARDMRTYAPAELLEHVDLVIRVYETYATAPDPINVPIVGPDAALLAEAAIAMDAYCDIVRGQPPYEDLN